MTSGWVHFHLWVNYSFNHSFYIFSYDSSSGYFSNYFGGY